MIISLKAFLGGSLLGIIFRLLRLPIPAPAVIAGIVGVLGVYLGGFFIPELF